jgi:uncharacterized sulfatase
MEDQESRKGKPFFIVAGFHNRHVPHVAPQRFFACIRSTRCADGVPAGDEKDIPRGAWRAGGTTSPTCRPTSSATSSAAYYACVSYVDVRIGQVFAAMDRLKLWGRHDRLLHRRPRLALRRASLVGQGEPVRGIVPRSADRRCAGREGGEHVRRVVEFLGIAPTLTELCHSRPCRRGRAGASRVCWPSGAAVGSRRVSPRCPTAGRSVRDERYRYTGMGRREGGARSYTTTTPIRGRSPISRRPPRMRSRCAPAVRSCTSLHRLRQIVLKDDGRSDAPRFRRG